MAEYNEYEQVCLDSLKQAMKTVKKTNNFIVDIGSSFNSWFLDLPFTGILIEMELEKIMKMPFSMYKKVHAKVTTSNICQILKDNNTPKDFYMMNLDIDGIDLWILHSVLKEYQPKIIITEINEKIPYPVKFSIINDPNFYWNWCHLFGYSIACLEDIMKLYNYSIFSLDMNNIILVKNSDEEKPNINKIEEIYKDGYLNHPIVPPPGWNDDVTHLQNCKTKEDVATKWRNYFLNNPNPNDGSDQSLNIDKYVINESYEKYLKEFLKK
jgi:hypothetical protein